MNVWMYYLLQRNVVIYVLLLVENLSTIVHEGTGYPSKGLCRGVNFSGYISALGDKMCNKSFKWSSDNYHSYLYNYYTKLPYGVSDS